MPSFPAPSGLARVHVHTLRQIRLILARMDTSVLPFPPQSQFACSTEQHTDPFFVARLPAEEKLTFLLHTNPLERAKNSPAG